MTEHLLKAEKREITGRKVKRLRAENKIPGTLFGKGLKSQNVTVSKDELVKTYKAAGETGLVDLHVAGKTHPVLITNIQVHPVTDAVLHVDFREVDLTQKVKAMVPVELVGESPAEKQGLGTVVLMIDEVEIEALPADLLEKFEIDATLLTEVEQTFEVNELKYDKKKIEILTGMDQILAKVEPPQKEEVVETPVTVVEGEETPAAEGGEGTPAEGAAPQPEEKKE